MSRVPASLRSLICATIILCGATLAPASAAERGADAAEVVEMLNESASAFEHRDLAAASRAWSHSEALTVFEGGHVNRGWTDYRDNHLGPEMKELRTVRYRLFEVVPHVAGDTAWATFRYTISGSEIKGRAFSGGGIGTAVLQRELGGWRIVHWHSTSTPKRAR
ncbi:MAG TPA: nuclear transport factor 2 family protein [Candidatus Elarobacter sp.]|jgi:ketosteroid isomerase-like protein